jgi:multidrug efflux pump subunit AcrA (membrane-fusion protein)
MITTLCYSQSEAVAQDHFVAKDAVLRIHESRDIASKAAGMILKSTIREGSLVKDKQLLMEIDSRLAKLNVEKLVNEKEIASREAASTVELDFMTKSIDVAKTELSRALQSNNRLPGAVPKSEIDQLRLVAERAIAEKQKTAFEMQIMAMQTTIRDIELNVGKRQLADHQINSPIDGKVVEIYKKEGEWVNASEPVAKVVQLKKLKTEIKVPASIALDQLVGTKAVFSPALDSLEGETFEGTVTFVYPEANPVNRQMKVWVVIDNRELKLVPGLVGSVKLLREPVEPQNVKTISAR